MAKNNTTFVVIAVVVAIVIIDGKFFSTNYAVIGPDLSRTVPPKVNTGSTFTVSYATIGAPATSKWFVAFDDNVTGGCSPVEYKNFMASETGGDSSQTKTFTAPAVAANCTFSGVFNYANYTTNPFPTVTVNICAPKTCLSLGYNCGNWSDTCSATLNCGTAGAGQQCIAGTIRTCKTDADTDCNLILTFVELNTYAQKWTAGTATWAQLINVASAWVTS